jgi:hypothetical protein
VSVKQIAAVRAKIQADIAKLRADHAECAQLIAADRAALQSARAVLEAQLSPLRQKLADDQANCAATLHADQVALHQAYAAGQATIVADLAAVQAAGADSALRHAALEKLAADQHALQQALAPLTETLHHDSAECAALLAADRKAIEDVMHNDTAVQQAHDKLLADTRSCLQRLAADRHQLIADMLKLRDDLAHRCHDGDVHTA